MTRAWGWPKSPVGGWVGGWMSPQEPAGCTRRRCFLGASGALALHPGSSTSNLLTSSRDGACLCTTACSPANARACSLVQAPGGFSMCPAAPSLPSQFWAPTRACRWGLELVPFPTFSWANPWRASVPAPSLVCMPAPALSLPTAQPVRLRLRLPPAADMELPHPQDGGGPAAHRQHGLPLQLWGEGWAVPPCAARGACWAGSSLCSK